MRRVKPSKSKKILAILGLALLLLLSYTAYYFLNNQNVASEDASAAQVTTVDLNGLTLTLYPKNNSISSYVNRLTNSGKVAKTMWVYRVTGKVSSCYSAVTVEAKQDTASKEKYNIVVNLQGSNCSDGTRSVREINQTGTLINNSNQLTYHFELNYSDSKTNKENVSQVEGFTLTSSQDYVSNRVFQESDVARNKKLALNGWKYRIQGVTSGCYISTESVDTYTGVHTLSLNYSQKTKNGVDCKNLKNKIDISNAVVSNYKGERSLKLKFNRDGVAEVISKKTQQNDSTLVSFGYTLNYKYLGNNSWSYTIASPASSICLSKLSVDARVMESYPEKVAIVGTVTKVTDTPNSGDCNETKPQTIQSKVSASEKATFQFQIKKDGRTWPAD